MKIQLSLQPDKSNEYLHEDQHTVLITSCSFFPVMENVSDKSCRENQNLYLMLNNCFLKMMSFMR
jgi:hypothetical protein